MPRLASIVFVEAVLERTPAGAGLEFVMLPIIIAILVSSRRN